MIGCICVLLSFRGVTAAQVDPDEEIAFYGPYLYWENNTTLALVLRGRFFESERDGAVRRATIDRLFAPALFRYIDKRPAEFDEPARSLMYERFGLFVADGESGESLDVRLVGKGAAATVTLPETDGGGYFDTTIRGTDQGSLAELAGTGDELLVNVVMPRDDPRRFAVRLAVPPRQLPLLVISDVDDTVRISEVTRRPRMIERVFLRRFEPVPGMAPIYAQLARRGAQFHFVSGSPWQVAPLIEAMLREHQFPRAAFHCRHIGWDFWNSDPLDTHAFKVRTITRLLEQFPACAVLLVGDDGEHDPEVYCEIARAHPDRVQGVWIRRVRSEWEPARLAGAREAIGDGGAVAFELAEELEGALRRWDRNGW